MIQVSRISCEKVINRWEKTLHSNSGFSWPSNCPYRNHNVIYWPLTRSYHCLQRYFATINNNCLFGLFSQYQAINRPSGSVGEPSKWQLIHNIHGMDRMKRISKATFIYSTSACAAMQHKDAILPMYETSLWKWYGHPFQDTALRVSELLMEMRRS